MKKEIRTLLVRLGYYSRPSFMIIGAQKAGTTALFDTLKQHSLVRGSIMKEVGYFHNDDWYSNGKIHQYHACFPMPHRIPRHSILFEATPAYLYHPKIAARLHDYNPQLKLIVMLRNPTERALSAWTMFHYHFVTGPFNYLLDNRSFKEAIFDDLKRVDSIGGWYEDNVGYVKRGIYHYQIETYFKHFRRDQILFIESDDFKKNFEHNSNRIQSFIGVPYEKLSIVKSNAGRVNETDKYMDTLAHLSNFYKPHNEKLFSLINQKFDWDL